MPEGTYPGKVTSHGLIKSKEKQTPGLSIRLQYETPEGFKAITRVYWVSAKALEFTLKMLKEVFGWTGSNIRDLHDNGAGGGFSLVGSPCEVVTEFEHFTDPNSGEDKKSLKVKFLNPVGGGGDIHEPMEDADIAALSEQIKGSIVKHRQDNNEEIVNESTGEITSGAAKNDDLPF